ncbi:M24 family metallopeptidase [Paenibacillus agricola]|uniref:Aminopeptidase P family protein n=1 Tax=Paenibacillus agricola TaxID=2716264 RepID=A0ABX0JFP5_9BACL|nr:Xaa-Pro peptidase family protein [Paenibacillus agricola]NHN32681.1 aminopeptidase P family protein [Paenibacillus agricola]
MESKRIEKIREQLKLHELDALLITKRCNRKYVSGFTSSAGCVLITKSEAILFTDFRYRIQATKQAVLYKVIEYTGQPETMLSKWLNSLQIHRLGFEQSDVSYGAYLALQGAFNGVELVPTHHLVEQLRSYKDDYELKMIRKAVEIADMAFEHILGILKPGMSERAVAAELEYFIRRNGAPSSAFPMIIASGVNSALPHGYASEKVIVTNEFITMDFGAEYEGYLSDLTRTVIVGQPTAKHKEIYGIVLEANLAAIQNLKPGMSGVEADSLARDIISYYNYGDCFGHGLGHGIGLEIHEKERFSQDSSMVLEAGMVMTIEPGIYIPGWGGVRIEDDILITPTGIEVLTQARKEFILI